MSIIDEIMEYVEKEYPKEACGLIGLKDNIRYWHPCRNIAENPEETFKMHSEDYIRAVLYYDEIDSIVHSHTNGSEEPSEHDEKACKFLGIKYMIISWPKGGIAVINP